MRLYRAKYHEEARTPIGQNHVFSLSQRVRGKRIDREPVQDEMRS